jgi:hypothetical protein
MKQQLAGLRAYPPSHVRPINMLKLQTLQPSQPPRRHDELDASIRISKIFNDMNSNPANPLFESAGRALSISLIDLRVGEW